MKKSYFLSSLFAAMFALPVSADVIGMKTAAAVGEKLSLALDENVKATLTWGDGSTEELSFEGKELEISVKTADFTLQTDQKVTRLYCPDCALTELNLSEAPNLVSLVCPNNQLTKLNLSDTKNLVELNCEGNQISALVSLYMATRLENLNASNNKLSSLGVTKLTGLKTLLCANNNLKSLTLGNLDKLTTLWCQGNSFTKLIFSNEAQLKQLCLFDNKLTALDAKYLNTVKDLWVDNNELTSLDLSAAHLETFSASNNKLTSILLSAKKDDALKAFYVDGNQLMFNSLPTAYNYSKNDTVIAYNIDNQLPFVIAESVNINEELDFGNYVRRNAWGDFTQVKLTLKDAEGVELIKNQDFNYLSGKCTIFKPYSEVNISMTSRLFPGAEFRFAPFAVVDPTGIDDVNSDNSFRLSVLGNQLSVNCTVATVVKVYNVSGALVVNENVAAGSTTWTLPAGIYVVNGKKVVLGR